jgi:hypothetical protein
MRPSALAPPLAALLLAGCVPPAAEPVVPIEPSVGGPVEPATISDEPPSAANPFALHRQWRGSYVCPQGETSLVLRVREVRGNAVVAVFDFDHPPTNVHGAYLVSGTYNPREHALALEPVRWLNRPPNYVMVGLSGTLGPGERQYEGRITYPDCEDFSLAPDNSL